MRVAICQAWEESEQGWGPRSDGCSLHLTKEQRKIYVDNFYINQRARLGSSADIYSRVIGEPFLVVVDYEIFARIRDSDNGIRLWQNDYIKLRNEQDEFLRKQALKALKKNKK